MSSSLLGVNLRGRESNRIRRLYVYDALGNAISVLDPNGVNGSTSPTKYSYNSFGSLTKVVQPDPAGGSGSVRQDAHIGK